MKLRKIGKKLVSTALVAALGMSLTASLPVVLHLLMVKKQVMRAENLSLVVHIL